MQTKTAVAISAITLSTLIGVGVASAQGGFGFMGTLDPEEAATRMEQRFETEADVLGTDLETVKDAWASGKNLHELADELGIDDDTLRTKMQGQHLTRVNEELDALVAQGTITQEQADARLQTMTEHMEDGDGFGPGGRGMGRGHGGGMMME